MFVYHEKKGGAEYELKIFNWYIRNHYQPLIVVSIEIRRKKKQTNYLRAQFLVLLWFVLFPHTMALIVWQWFVWHLSALNPKWNRKLKWKKSIAIWFLLSLLLLLLLHLVLSVLRFQLQKIVILHPKLMQNIQYEKRKNKKEQATTTYLRQSISTENELINKWLMWWIANASCWIFRLANGLPMIDERYKAYLSSKFSLYIHIVNVCYGTNVAAPSKCDSNA